MSEYITYKDLRLLAIKDNIPDNKISIGIWAKINGYFQIKKRIDNILTVLYFRDNNINQ